MGEFWTWANGSPWLATLLGLFTVGILGSGIVKILTSFFKCFHKPAPPKVTVRVVLPSSAGIDIPVASHPVEEETQRRLTDQVGALLRRAAGAEEEDPVERPSAWERLQGGDE